MEIKGLNVLKFRERNIFDEHDHDDHAKKEDDHDDHDDHDKKEDNHDDHDDHHKEEDGHDDHVMMNMKDMHTANTTLIFG